MNTTKSSNLSQKKQALTFLWLVFLTNTISFPIVGFIISQNRGYDPSLNSNLGGALMLAIGFVFFVISHLIFKKISTKPIQVDRYQVSFIISCFLADAISILSLLHINTANMDKFAYVLFALGFLGVVTKKPNTNLLFIENNRTVL